MDQEDCKVALEFILKSQMERLLVENEEAMEIRTEESKRSGLYAKETIDQILKGYKQCTVEGDDDTFM